MSARRMIILSTGLCTMLSLAACKTTEITTAIGATVGAVGGSQIGNGGWGTVAATVGLAALGAFIGSEIGDALDERSKEQASTAAGGAIVKGENSSWSNPQAGTKGSATVTGESTRKADVTVTTLKDRVEQTPPLELVGANFATTGVANVRGGPGTDYKVVDALPKGQVVEVVGKVQGKAWYLISQGGVATGFVSTTLLRPTDAPATAARPAGETESRQVAALGTCRTVTQTITLADGTTKSDDVTACQTETGWQVQ